MGLGKFIACIAGGAVAIVAAPVVLPVAAAAGGMALAAAGAVGSAAATVAGATGLTAAAGAVGSAAATVAGATGATTVGSAVAGATASAVSTLSAAAATAASATGLTTAAGVVGGKAVAVVGAQNIVAGAIGSSMTYSTTTTAEGFSTIEDAKKKISAAQKKYNIAMESHEKRCKRTANKLSNLERKKLEVYSSLFPASISIFKNILIVKERDTTFFEELDVAEMFNREKLEDFEKISIDATDVLTALGRGAVMGHGATAGAVTLATQFGVASTGTAISTLSGAAAQKAMLAALGGGAIKAGGGGMALGSAVIGGISILPSAMVMSWKFASHAQKQLTEAYKYHAKVEEEIAKMRLAKSAMNCVDKRINEISTVIDKLTSRYEDVVFPNLVRVYSSYAKSDGSMLFTKCSRVDKDSILLSACFLKSLKEILQAKVLDKNNNPHKESEKVLAEIRNNTVVAEALEYA